MIFEIKPFILIFCMIRKFNIYNSLQSTAAI